jgi:hypothetical protein
MTLEVRMFEPNTDGLLNANHADANQRQKVSHIQQDNAPLIGILGTSVLDLRWKCMAFIKSMVSKENYAIGVSPKDGSKLSKDVLKAVHKFSLMEPMQPVGGLIPYETNFQMLT